MGWRSAYRTGYIIRESKACYTGPTDDLRYITSKEKKWNLNISTETTPSTPTQTIQYPNNTFNPTPINTHHNNRRVEKNQPCKIRHRERHRTQNDNSCRCPPTERGNRIENPSGPASECIYVWPATKRIEAPSPNLPDASCKCTV